MSLVQEMRRVVAGVVGDDDMAGRVVLALLSELGGERLYVPHNDYAARNAEMLDLYRHGAGIEALARRYRVHPRTVRRIVTRR